MKYAYIRVSTKEQNIDRQMAALKGFNIPQKRIFTDKSSGKNFERENYKKLIKRLKMNDVLIITSIDRLGRNYEEIIEQWRMITKEIGADIVVLDMELLDTRQHKNLLGTFVADMVLQILGFVAESERENIHRIQAEGIAAAKARGVKFGRPKKFITDNYTDIHKLYRQKKLSKKEAKQRIGCGESTFQHIMHTLDKKQKDCYKSTKLSENLYFFNYVYS